MSEAANTERTTSSSPKYVLGRSTQSQQYIARCLDDKCPWKHRNDCTEAIHIAGEAHVLTTGHGVEIEEIDRTRIPGRIEVER